jgi:transcriptional regulator with XRE-family HTH domain
VFTISQPGDAYDVALEENLKKNLKLLRKKRFLTQETLAEKAGLEYKYIQMLEGRIPPSATLRTLEKLGKALRLDPWQLIKPPKTEKK